MSPFEAMAKIAIEKAMENIPPETLAQIGQIGQIVISVRAQLDRIEAQNRMIMDRLGIGNQEADNARRSLEFGDGPGKAGGSEPGD